MHFFFFFFAVFLGISKKSSTFAALFVSYTRTRTYAREEGIIEKKNMSQMANEIVKYEVRKG